MVVTGTEDALILSNTTHKIETDRERKRPPGTTSSCHPSSTAALVQGEHQSTLQSLWHIQCNVYAIVSAMKLHNGSDIFCIVYRHKITLDYVLLLCISYAWKWPWMRVHEHAFMSMFCFESGQRQVVQRDRPSKCSKVRSASYLLQHATEIRHQAPFVYSLPGIIVWQHNFLRGRSFTWCTQPCWGIKNEQDPHNVSTLWFGKD